ncbi:hypothetical protein [Pedobacter sp. GR22-6]|uniref:hypothetical protein n=1 Tax=Pedobacter sp. GR22-6 TaxID=3127957 RepID=UPI00307D84DE
MKLYDIFLDNNKIGTTELEKGDASMGGVFGKITFINISSGYDFFKTYCVTNDIELVTDYPEDRLILTRTINNLAVKNEVGIEIKGVGNQISGMDSDEFEISLEGVPYPFYEEEFPHHVKAYDNQFNNEQ